MRGSMDPTAVGGSGAPPDPPFDPPLEGACVNPSCSSLCYCCCSYPPRCAATTLCLGQAKEFGGGKGTCARYPGVCTRVWRRQGRHAGYRRCGINFKSRWGRQLRTNCVHSFDVEWLKMLWWINVSVSSWCAGVECDVMVNDKKLHLAWLGSPKTQPSIITPTVIRAPNCVWSSLTIRKSWKIYISTTITNALIRLSLLEAVRNLNYFYHIYTCGKPR